MFRATIYALALLAIANPSLADEVSDTLSSALQAYEDGDIEYAIEELENRSASCCLKRSS